jgi:predicted lipoprotein with Yx(FWY)xxD motif
MTRSLLILPVSIAAVFAVAGCGGGSSGTKASSTATPASTPAAKTAPANTVAVSKTDLGRILVDAQGRTLYLFEKDKHGKSACSGECANDWPPLITKGAATAGTGAVAKSLGTTTRSDGAMQATYGGHPLYLYEGDSAPKQTNGEGLKAFGAEWYVLAPSGKKVENEGS